MLNGLFLPAGLCVRLDNHQYQCERYKTTWLEEGDTAAFGSREPLAQWCCIVKPCGACTLGCHGEVGQVPRGCSPLWLASCSQKKVEGYIKAVILPGFAGERERSHL